MPRDQARALLEATLAELGDEELLIVGYLADRLLEGQLSYGRLHLEADPRDWKRERAEECADLLVYTAFAALKEAAPWR